jgi:hypothetical protein
MWVGYTFDVELFKLILSMREGLPFPVHRKEIQQYLRLLTSEEKQEIRDRREEIINKWVTWKESNHYVLTHIGFTDEMADMLDDKRLESPGMRQVLLNRAVELGYAKKDAEGIVTLIERKGRRRLNG